MVVNTEFRKGVFFVRMKGRIDNEGYLRDIKYLIDVIGINLIVLNINYINYLSIDNVNDINNFYRDILKKKKLLYLCDGRNRFRLVPVLDNEMEAFSLV